MKHTIQINSRLLFCLKVGIGLLVFIFSFILISGVRGDNVVLREKLWKNSLFKGLIIQREKTKLLAKSTWLSFQQPSFEGFVLSIKSPQSPDVTELKNILVYYESAAQVFPNNAEIQGLLGFIYFHLNDQDKAMHAYQRAAALKGKFFWHQYNLAVLNYIKGNYDLASNYLEKALQISPTDALSEIVKSKVYLQIFWPVKDFSGIAIGQNLWQGYHDASLLALYVYQKLSKYEKIEKLSREAIAAKFDKSGEFSAWVKIGETGKSDARNVMPPKEILVLKIF